MPNEDFPGADERRGIRHSVRTFLNHIAGYGDILRQEAEDSGEAGLCETYDGIRQAALELRELALPFFLEPSEGGIAEEDRPERERAIYGALYDIIALIQGAKRRGDAEWTSRFLPDTEKILEAANGIVEIFEERLEAHRDFVEEYEPEALPVGLGDVELPPAPKAGRILVVDDNLFNRELLGRHLERQGHVVCQAADGASSLEILRHAPFDVLVLDVMMPGMNGYQLLEAVKADERLKDLYVIVISALDDTKSIARCIQLGAEDYLPREFEPVILKARIESCLEKKSLKDKEELYVAAVMETERRLRAELQEGAAYVRGLLPPRLPGPGLKSDWVFIPSLSLGGDVFGYHAIEGGRVALYLIDVSGHGIEAALFSVTLMNMLKTQVLPRADFGEPSSVLERLNASFRMEEQNNLYFTAWYGVWDPATRELAYASAGAPPAVLLLPGGGVEQLETGGMIVGVDEGAEYRSERMVLPAGSSLYLFSDGIYEIRTQDGSVLGIEAFVGLLAGLAARGRGPLLPALIESVRGLAKKRRFEDDVSMLEFVFG